MRLMCHVSETAVSLIVWVCSFEPLYVFANVVEANLGTIFTWSLSMGLINCTFEAQHSIEPLIQSTHVRCLTSHSTKSRDF